MFVVNYIRHENNKFIFCSRSEGTMMLEAGLKGHEELIVEKKDTAGVYGSGTLDVLATPAMIALMEKTCLNSVAASLDAGQGTVGTQICVKHLAATPMGMKVTCESLLREVDRRRLVFEVTAFDESGKIGEGTHERFVIDEAKFQAKTDAKKNQED